MNTPKVKLLLLGDAGVGKTSLCRRFLNDDFRQTYEHTIGIDFVEKDVCIGNDRLIKTQLWDTAGQERFRSLIRPYYSNASGIVICFDLTDAESFANVNYWMENVISNNRDGHFVKTFLVGNKSDLADAVVSPEAAMIRAEELGSLYLAVSAKEGKNVENAFVTMVKSIVEENSDFYDDFDTITLSDYNEHENRNDKKRKKCC